MDSCHIRFTGKFGGTMVRELIVIILFILSSNVFAMTLKGAEKVIELEKEKNGYHFSKNCSSCTAMQTIQSLNKEKITFLMKQEKDQRVSPGSRLCSALGANVWVLEDEKKVEWGVCQFKDGSAILTDDLGKLIQEKL